MKAATLLLAVMGVLQVSRPPGLEFVHRNSPTSQKYLVETMGGGVALLDFNNDGRLDVFLVNGGKLDDPQRSPPDFDRRNPLYWNRLFRQNVDGSFTDVTAAAGLAQVGNVYGMGVAAGDYDNDGFPDLYVTNYGANALYRNQGDGTFRDLTQKAGVAGGGWSVSAGFLDYDNDGLLDLFVSRYLQWEIQSNLLCGTPFYAYCRPDKYKGTTNLLFHNEGEGRFRDVSGTSGIAAAVGKGMGVAFDDYDGDQKADIFVSNDGMEQFLFRNLGDGKFEERAVPAGVAYGNDGATFAGMGAVWGDYDNNGLPDIVVTNLALEKYAIYRNEGAGHFAYASLTSGLAALTARNSGWGLALQDFDNDGWKDLFVAQSHVLDNVERIRPNLRYLEPPTLLLNREGKFQRADLGTLPAVAGRGTAVGDLDNDGSLDAVISVLGDRPIVFKGHRNGNHWLTIKLEGTTSNRSGLGAEVRVNGQRGYATTSGSYLSAGDSRVHFGLGTETKATVQVRWPSGKRQIVENVAVDRILTVQEQP